MTVDSTDRASVLLVDDEEALVTLYGKHLEERYDVQTATSGEAALSLADESLDVVLLDRRMPDYSGSEVLHRLRESGVDAQVAMLTAVEPSTDIVEMPFDDYRVKPVKQSDLLGLVEVLLERACYDEYSRKFFALASKKAALEVAGNDSGEEYETLCAEMESIRDRIDDSLERVGSKAAFADLSTSF